MMRLGIRYYISGTASHQTRDVNLNDTTYFSHEREFMLVEQVRVQLFRNIMVLFWAISEF